MRDCPSERLNICFLLITRTKLTHFEIGSSDKTAEINEQDKIKIKLKNKKSEELETFSSSIFSLRVQISLNNNTVPTK